MKKINLLLLIACIIAGSVNAQTKKIIAEEFTGEWCVYCPYGTQLFEEEYNYHIDNIIPIGVHVYDPFAIPEAESMGDTLQVPGFPCVALDRFKRLNKLTFSLQSIASAYYARLEDSAIASISFSNMVKTGNTYTAKVNVKFTKAPNPGVPLKVNVYITEDSVMAISQKNNNEGIQGGQSPLTNWYHPHVLRLAVGGAWGYAAIPATVVVGTTYSQDVTFDVPTTWVSKNVNVIAYVAYDGTAGDNKKEIINAEQSMLSNWNTAPPPTGIKELNTNRMNMGVYPNPANLSSVIKTSFELKEDATVTMKVVNISGQVVSLPYSSFEIKGAHTIQWNPREKGGITPGIYFIELSTDKGDAQTSRIVLQ